MVLKIIGATEARVGTNILIDGKPFTVKKIDISKTGKHGHAKARIEATGIISPGKKVFVMPGHDKLEIPMISKNKGQVLSISDNKISVMDLESFETLDVPCAEEIKSTLEENSNVEYWDIEGELIVKRKI
jgi:translation initiation factor 5A